MAEHTTPVTRSGGGDGAPSTAKSTSHKTLPASLAAAGRWAGERDRGRGWEDYLAEFLAALLTWGGIGFLLDRWLGTDPWLLIAGLVLGNGLGIYLLWVRSNADVTPAQRAVEARWRTTGRAAGLAETATREDRP